MPSDKYSQEFRSDATLTCWDDSESRIKIGKEIYSALTDAGFVRQAAWRGGLPRNTNEIVEIKQGSRMIDSVLSSTLTVYDSMAKPDRNDYLINLLAIKRPETDGLPEKEWSELIVEIAYSGMIDSSQVEKAIEYLEEDSEKIKDIFQQFLVDRSEQENVQKGLDVVLEKA